MIKESKNSIRSIQLLRALAALCVVYFHCTASRGGYNFPHTGSFGVDIFFVISGFIIAFMVSKNTARFFIKRIIRIEPLYIIATLLMSFVVLLFPNLIYSTIVNFTTVIKSLLFIPYKTETRENPILEPGWTLNFEMFFYLVMSLCIIVIKNKRLLPLACGIVLVFFLVVLNLIKPENYILNTYKDGLFPEFIYGLILFYLYDSIKDKIPKGNLLLAFLILIAVFSFIFLIVKDICKISITNNRNIYYGIPAFLLVSSILFTENHLNSVSKTNLFLKVGLELGDASYAMYLFHPFVILFLSRVSFPIILKNNHSLPIELIKLILAIISTALISILIYEIIDIPIRKKLRILLKGSPGYVL